MSEPAIYRISESDQANTVTVDNVWTQSGTGIAPGLTNLITFPWDDGVLLLGQAADGSVASYKLADTAPHVTPLASNFDLAGPCDILRPFVIGGVQHLIAYRAQSGELSFHRVNDDLTLSKPMKSRRLRSPGLTTGWTLMEPLTYLGMVYYVSYDIKSGAVQMFDVNVTATSEGGVPPLRTLNVWSWQWAHGWTNFAFFQLGGDNFFFKINVDIPNVNIDHLSTNPNQRSNEVCTHKGDIMPDNQDHSLLVRPLTLSHGAPYLVSYMPSGTTRVFRVHADCQAWTQEAQADTVAGASDVVTYRIGEQSFALFY
jgi:hypothetical protein